MNILTPSTNRDDNNAASPPRSARIVGATLIAWLPTGMSVAFAVADYSIVFVATLAFIGFAATASLAAYVWEVAYGDAA